MIAKFLYLVNPCGIWYNGGDGKTEHIGGQGSRREKRGAGNAGSCA